MYKNPSCHGCLKPEFRPQVHVTHLLVFKDDARRAFRDHLSLVEDVGMVANAQGLPDVVIGDQDADIAVAQVFDDLLDVNDGNRRNTICLALQVDSYLEIKLRYEL